MLFIESCRWLCLAFFWGGYDKLVIVSLQLWKISLTIAFPRETTPSFWNQSRCLHNLLVLLYCIKSELSRYFWVYLFVWLFGRREQPLISDNEALRHVLWQELTLLSQVLSSHLDTGSGDWTFDSRGESDFPLFLSHSKRLPGKFSSLLDRTRR